MRSRSWTALVAVSIVVLASLGRPAQAGTAPAADPAPTGTGYRFTDLGPDFYPYRVNNSGVAAGLYNAASAASASVAPSRIRPFDAGGQGVWRNGRVTRLPLPGGYGGGVVTVTDSGDLEGTVYTDTGSNTTVWHPPYSAASTIVAGGNTYYGDETSGNLAIGRGNPTVVSIIAPSGAVLRTLSANTFPRAVGSTEFVGQDAAGAFVAPIASGTRTALDFAPGAMSPDGAIVGYQNSGNEPGVLRFADGSESPLPISQPGLIDARHDVASSTQLLPAGSTTPVAVASLVPAGWTSAELYGMSNNGIVVGHAVDRAGAGHGFMLTPQVGSITGQVLRGSAPNTAYTPQHAAAGITVTAVGRTSSGATVRTKDVTDSAGRYTLDTPPGSYTVTFPSGVCASVRGKACVTSTKAAVTTSRTPVVDAVALAALLKVTVTLAPDKVTLPYDRKSSATEPRTVAVRLTVRNIGVRPATSVRAPAQLTRSYNAVNVVKVPQIPITQTAGPEIAGRRTAAIGTLAPGKAKVVTYSLRVTGDGVYDVEGLVLGSQALLGRTNGTGKATLKIGAPVLVMHLAFGRGAKGANGRALIQAGTPFTIAATLENRSYTKTLFVQPPKVTLDGNAAGGVFVAAGAPLANPQNPGALQINQYFTLAPRRTVKAEIVVRTSRTSADVQDSLGSSRGGTRAVVTVAEPVVDEVTADDAVGARIPANQVFVAGDDTYQVGLDDSSMRAEPEPKTALGYILAITNGTFGALWNLTIGGAIGLFQGLGAIATSGVLLRLPRSIINYLEAEADLWESIRQGPTKGEFLDYFNSWLTLAYVHATGVRNSLDSLKRSADAALVAHLNTIADDYENGDWRGAVAELSKEGTEVAGTLVLGTGVLTRWKPAAEAYQASKAALFAKFGEVLDAARGKLYIGAAEALETLAQAVPGYRFNFSDMANYYGLSEAQVTWLLKFCKEENILVTLRSRAAESLAWLDKGAVLKPEQIKIKTVAWLDAKWLGFGEKNIGRVIIRPREFLPSEPTLIAKLRAAGLGPRDAEYQETVARLRARLAELSEPASHEGYGGFIEQAAKDKKMTLRWNLEENSVNPDYAPNGYTTYEFRLAQDADAGSGNFVAQFKVNGVWRSVTGDVDLLSIVGADGTPLSEARRVAIYSLISKGPLGLMHPAVDTWTELTKVGGKIVDKTFSFEKKLAEMDRGTAAQLAPDLQVRAVTFNKELSSFGDVDSYKVWWNEGYNQVAGTPIPSP